MLLQIKSFFRSALKLELEIPLSHIDFPNTAMTSPCRLCLAYGPGLSELSQTSTEKFFTLQEMPVVHPLHFIRG